ncbi:protein dimmed [Anopheles bellator]|uniref:protein dimmed n=1 Tax=Anopheles bellator TaxID=139047 RepID=UPI0026499B75|nr:protein dimmed [Anopheles bellator]
MRSDLSDDKHGVQLAAAEIAESSDTSGFYELASNGSTNGIINGSGVINTTQHSHNQQLHQHHQHGQHDHHLHPDHHHHHHHLLLADDLQDKGQSKVLLQTESLSEHTDGIMLRSTSRPKRATRRMQMEATIDPDMTDSSSQSDDTSCGSSRTGSRGSNGGRSAPGANGNGNSSSSAARRRKGALNAKERNARRLESNERERMRMHSLNDAFQSLREVIPHVKKERRLSKIETLTLAKNYITALTDVIIVMRGEGEAAAALAPGTPGLLLHNAIPLPETAAALQSNVSKSPEVGGPCHATDVDQISTTLDIIASASSVLDCHDTTHHAPLPHHHGHHHLGDGGSTGHVSSNGNSNSTNTNGTNSTLDVAIVTGAPNGHHHHHGSINNNHLNTHHFNNNSASSIDIENSFYEDPFQMM